MSVANQATVNYAYDATDRLTQIQQGSATVSYAYDNADRVTSMTLPNGMVSEYSYDNGSRLTGITYKKGGVTIGTLTYRYDALGRRVSLGGSLAQVNLPSALTTTAYNDANQQTAFGSQTLSYDNNGNLTEITDRESQVTLSRIAFCLEICIELQIPTPYYRRSFRMLLLVCSSLPNFSRG